MTDYTTTAQVKAILSETAMAVNAADDVVIAQMITAVSGYFDTTVQRTFVSASGTRYYDVPLDDPYTLAVDDYTELTSITNGDGTSVSLTNVLMLPANIYPKTAIKFKLSSGLAWVSNGIGDTEQVISVTAKWGAFPTCPPEIRTAVEGMVVNLYQARRGVGSEGVATITAAGLVITPKDVTPFAADVLKKYGGRIL